MKMGDIDNGALGAMVFQCLPVLNLDKHVPGIEAVPCIFGDDPDRDPEFWVGPGKAVLHKDILALKIGLETVVERLEPLLIKRMVLFAPPDMLFACRLLDHELVFPGQPSMMTGPDHDRPLVSNQTFPAFYNLLIEGSRRQVPVDLSYVFEVEIFQG